MIPPTERLEEVPVDEIVIGDTLLVRPGEVVPVDAILLTTEASFDESSLTGESLPVERTHGELIASGVVNGQAAIYLRAKSLAADSQYQQIVALVEQAQQSKAPTVRLADRYALPFTVFSLAIAAAAWAISGDPTRFAEVLVVATPCPLLIAAPAVTRRVIQGCGLTAQGCSATALALKPPLGSMQTTSAARQHESIDAHRSCCRIASSPASAATRELRAALQLLRDFLA